MPKTRMNTRKTEKPLRFLGFLFWSEWRDLNPCNIRYGSRYYAFYNLHM